MAKTILIPSGVRKLDDQVLKILTKHDLPKLIELKTGLSWKTPSIKIKHTQKKADWENNDTVLVNFENGTWCISGIAHELVHLILRQNNWLDNPTISNYVKRHRELRETSRGDGYPIEQMIAYLIQSEILADLGKKESVEIPAKFWDEKHFENVINYEYDSEYKKRLGRLIISAWRSRRREGTNLIGWLEELLRGSRLQRYK